MGSEMCIRDSFTASVTLLIPTLLVVRTQTLESWQRENSENVCPQRWLITIKLLLFPLSVCVCIDLCPPNATKAIPISAMTPSVEASYLYLHPPLPASKAVSSSWRLVVVYALINTGVTGITSMYQADTTWNHALYTRAQYICTNIYGMYRYQRFACRIRINI